MKHNLFKYILIFSACLFILILLNKKIFIDTGAKSINKNNQDKEVINIEEDTKNIPQVKTIMIDPGHGGNDPGTSKNGLVEKDIAFTISKKLKTKLEQLGYNILMTRDGDTPNYKPTNVEGSTVRKDLDGRITYAKENNAILFVSIHVNSLPEDPGENGSIVYYYPNLEQSKNYTTNVQEMLNNIQMNDIIRKKQNIRIEDFYVIKYSEMPSMLIETGFITSSKDRKLLVQDIFVDKLATAISQGIDILKQ
jgi:N-acetylmuramoyl-L-alanine amidase